MTVLYKIAKKKLRGYKDFLYHHPNVLFVYSEIATRGWKESSVLTGNFWIRI